ncbi:MAG: hypothetical protein NT076_05660 [Candidatus Pacearchaeota archaeon]|nr:hypothetical protein [Candidatus Pacearchaeota archaeon]
MEIRDIEKVERQGGIASTIKVEDFILGYAEAVRRFLRDNQPAMGNSWVKGVGDRLYNLQGKNKEGDVLGSSTDIGVAIATFCPEIPLITGQQLLGIYNQAGNKNPFGNVYIDFGAQVNGTPEVNHVQAKVLLEEFKARGIEVGEGRVPNFAQLRLHVDKDAGLVYRLAENASADNIAVVSAYLFKNRVGKNGLFGAFLGRPDWFAYDGDLQYSCDAGRVVRYDAEGVARAEPTKSTPDLFSTLAEDFIRKF